jgi:uncharacterized protein with HEPN domain
MPPEAIGLCQDMLRSAQRIIHRTAGLNETQFLGDEDVVDIAYRHFGIIGEAMNSLRKIAPSIAAQISEFERIVRFRNQLIHSYRELDDRTTWRIIETKLPILIAELEGLLADAPPLDPSGGPT